MRMSPAGTVMGLALGWNTLNFWVSGEKPATVQRLKPLTPSMRNESLSAEFSEFFFHAKWKVSVRFSSTSGFSVSLALRGCSNWKVAE